jgi:hypothetical protein
MEPMVQCWQIDLDLDAENRDIIRAMVNAGYLTALALESAEVEDDDYNLVIVDRETREPVFAIEYWPVLNAKGDKNHENRKNSLHTAQLSTGSRLRLI